MNTMKIKLCVLKLGILSSDPLDINTFVEICVDFSAKISYPSINGGLASKMAELVILHACVHIVIVF